MKKVLIKISVAIFLVLTFIPSLSHAQQETPLTPAECFDYYKFGSVTVDINPAVEQTVSGAQLRFYLTVANQNDYPIVDGSIYVKIFQKQTDSKLAQKNGGFLVDQFFAKERIALDAKEVKNFELLWNVPAWAPEGEYRAFSYFQSAKKFNLLGFTFTDDITGGQADFRIKSEFKKSVGLDKNNVKANGTRQQYFSKDEPITVQMPILNPTKEKQEASVTYGLYFWDGLSDSQKLGTKNEKITLNPGEKKMLTYQITDSQYSVYYLVVKSQWHDFSSILDVRMIRRDISRPIIDFMGTTVFPIKKGEASTIFACIHNAIPGPFFDATDSSSTPKAAMVKLELSFLDNEKNLIQKYVYNGEVGGNVTGLKANLAPAKSYSRFSVKASLYDSQNKLMDEANLRYDCGEINKDKCLPKDQLSTTTLPSSSGPIKPIYLYVVLGIIVVGIAVTIVIRTRKKPPMEPPTGPTSTIPTGGMAGLLFLLIGLGVILGATTAQAKSTTVWMGVSGDLRNVSLLSGFDYGTFSLFYHITYNAKVTDESGAILNDGDIVYVGKKITFSYDSNDFLLDGSDTAIWDFWGWCLSTWGLGNVSPRRGVYGHWKDGGNYPYANPETYKEADFFASLISFGYPSISLYAPLSVSPPTITFDTSRAETTGVLGECSTTGTQRTCKVTGPGLIWDGVKFAKTDYEHYLDQLDTTSGVYTHLGTIYRRLFWGDGRIPEARIRFYLNAKNAPVIPVSINAPIITGQTAGIRDMRYTFSAQSLVNGPINQEYQYLFDWNGDENPPYVPTNYGPAGNVGSASFTWSSMGSKTFKVKTRDSDGNESPWSSHTIVISDAPVCTPSETWTPCTVPCGGGTTNLVDIDANCGSAIIRTDECNVQACGTIIKEVPP